MIGTLPFRQFQGHSINKINAYKFPVLRTLCYGAGQRLCLGLRIDSRFQTLKVATCRERTRLEVNTCNESRVVNQLRGDVSTGKMSDRSSVLHLDLMFLDLLIERTARDTQSFGGILHPAPLFLKHPLNMLLFQLEKSET